MRDLQSGPLLQLAFFRATEFEHLGISPSLGQPKGYHLK
ncbi:unnamed protein product [Acidithrix sp. C25]|nr:unnamed protein product [Acidithrix sp. C25]